ncbi:MAG: bifunctional DNA-formamidopyrimidine glycosylase/DNA-(apurinic or apyrimidinic site) lyase [Desulfovibrionaceae bacterium]|nr:bifunctional DNA-formamidopyrimidine glycosylase/DNA-(apurinic or apyrimidinic site) lyase [Desulfovibrionaceae bacterium]
MPELPEVETVVRTLKPHILGRTVLNVRTFGTSFLASGSRPLDTLCQASVTDVSRRGKYIVVHLLKCCTSLCLVAHLRMTGRLMAYERPQTSSPDFPDSFLDKHSRGLFLLGDRKDSTASCALVFHDVRKFGRLFAGTEEDLALWPSWTKLGPEPLEMGEEAFVQAMKGKRAIKKVLLDQTRLAGVGNIYTDESLFAAGIHPSSIADSVPPEKLRLLYRELCRILLLSIDECGSSIRDYQDADGNVGAFQNYFAVYGRKGEPCKNCGKPLERTEIGGRGTVFCRHCQRLFD